ncbi:MAG: CBS domain-containing protein [Prochlorococcus sp.]|jgi:CBS domain-containing protein|nr:CBS domain-containing protein [Prochlorococcaceae cyanobacterium ETNP2_MAG_10]MDP6196291.1 CBS domain-containing protein [Prochlorococcaceae cyanobacterium ETNP18_MAG_17]MDP6851114.1 CBS domain-containing protein [Prochlorococcaceae cyanobacterium ETNP1_MAG_8]MDP7327193.1 CBS domain-containing protein [Prochlorococcaceae cyanobacterium ETNP7_MAG_30]HJO78149.1 CBS domain-containing protein [Prochlorococcaceae cyanobacterium Fu_MAG_134]|tara:strand:- start:1832 stop:2302 length:471 start_codon:yes stop_codon:yes gene_type:complete
MVLQQTVKDVMSKPVITVLPATSLQEAVQLLTDQHISGLPVVNDEGQLVGELTEQDLMVRESGVDAGPYVLLLDSVIYLRNPLNWDKQVHQVLGTSVNDLMRSETHSCKETLPLARAAAMLHDRSTQRIFVIDEQRKPVGVITRGDVVRALARHGG